MRPLFEEFATFVDEAVKTVVVERTEARVDNQQMSRNQYIDEVELQQTDRLYGATNVSYVNGPWRAVAVETLRCNRNSPRLRTREGPTAHY